MSLFPPKNAAIRDPRDTKQANGKIYNPVRVQDPGPSQAKDGMGGFSSLGKLKKNLFAVEKPMKGAAPKGEKKSNYEG